MQSEKDSNSPEITAELAKNVFSDIVLMLLKSKYKFLKSQEGITGVCNVEAECLRELRESVRAIVNDFGGDGM